MLKSGDRGNSCRGFQVPATEACTLLPLVKIGERLAICCYPHKIFRWANVHLHATFEVTLHAGGPTYTWLGFPYLLIAYMHL